jgi:zinc and cadmium transporter
VHTLAWIVGATLAMSAIAWIGLVTAALNEEQLKKVLLPLVAFAAGSLLGGAFLHLLPEAVAARGPGVGTFLPALAGFALFFLMEQFLSWHHGHFIGAEAAAKQPVTYLILLADGLHNFIGGLAIGASFIVSTEVGIVTWLAAAAHEIPQELGDFGILIRGGWRRLPALAANFLSAATILPGGLLAYYLAADFDVTMLLSFAAGNFIYIAASDLIPEVKHERQLRKSLVHFGAFVAGVLVILMTRVLFAG